MQKKAIWNKLIPTKSILLTMPLSRPMSIHNLLFWGIHKTIIQSINNKCILLITRVIGETRMREEGIILVLLLLYIIIFLQNTLLDRPFLFARVIWSLQTLDYLLNPHQHLTLSKELMLRGFISKTFQDHLALVKIVNIDRGEEVVWVLSCDCMRYAKIWHNFMCITWMKI